MIKKVFQNAILMAMFNTLLFFPFVSEAQQAMLSTGGNAIGSGGNLNYSIGQSVYITETGIDANLSIGVIQPYEISVISGTAEGAGISLSCSIYPNPTLDQLTLLFDTKRISFEGLTYSLYNTAGVLIETHSIIDKETQINMRNYVLAAYILKIRQGKNEIRAFKVLKM